MNRRLVKVGLLAIALAAVAFGSTGGARAVRDNSDKIIEGDSAVVDAAGSRVSAWARVNGGGKVIWVGLTIPLSIVEEMPEPGTGPARAIAALNYPPIVKATTYFDHVQIQSNHHGHPTNPAFLDKTRFSAPHFDFHYH